MLPTFPTFKRLSIKDKKEIDSHVHQFPPYSDFNFTSLLSWDIDKGTHVSLLHNNIVIKLYDYIDKKPLITLLGKHNLRQSCEEVMTYAVAHNMAAQLSLIPEVVVHDLKKALKKHKGLLRCKKDEGNFDYIYTIQDILDLKGTRYRIKRKSIRRFKESHEKHTRLALLDPTSPDIVKQLLHIFREWGTIKNQSRSYIRNEFAAFKRLLRYAKQLPIDILGMYVEDKLSGFIVCEALPGKYGAMHFGKTNLRATGAFEYLIYKSTELLHAQGCEYLNLQQDLSIENLRHAKLSWRPSSFLRKYTITMVKPQL